MKTIPHRPRHPALATACLLALAGPLAWAAPSDTAPAAPVDVQPEVAHTTVAAAQTVTITGDRLVRSAPMPSTLEVLGSQQIEEAINSPTTAGLLQYLPSMHVRERYIGDRNGVLVMRVNSSIASAQTTVYADGLLLSNFLNNSFSTAPRWGLVSPEEIDNVEVLYGPFSALYPGNSAGGVVRLHTRQPTRFEAHVKLDHFTQRFEEYSTRGSFDGRHASASLADALGGFTYWLALDHLRNTSQPQTFGTATLRAGQTAKPAGFEATLPAGSKVVRDIDTSGQDRFVFAATGIDRTEQNLLKLKLGVTLTPSVWAGYTLGLWLNNATTLVQPYLRNTAGLPLYTVPTSVFGAGYQLTQATPQRAESEHHLHGLALKARSGDVQWELDASLYDQKSDVSRSPVLRVATDSGLGAVTPGGQVTRADGTGWHNLDLRGQWRLGAHTLSFGAHHDRYKLASVTYGTTASPVTDWLRSDRGVLNTNSFGKTRTDALYLQDEWRATPQWTLMLGARQERWKAYEGSNFNTAATNNKQLNYADRSSSDFSPKAHLAWAASPTLDLRASVGKATRYPTVQEMFQVFNGVGGVRQNDPNLRPEKVRSTELTGLHKWDSGQARLSWFHEHKTDALISQTDTTLNVTSIQNVDRLRTQGLELALQAQPASLPQLELSTSATYTRSRIVQDRRNPGLEGTAQPRIPDWRLTASGTWHASDAMAFTLAYRFSGRQHNQLFNTAAGRYNDVNPNVYGAVSHYSVFDAKLHWKLNPNWGLDLGVNNLGSFKYYVNPNPYPQRTFFASLKYDL